MAAAAVETRTRRRPPAADHPFRSGRQVSDRSPGAEEAIITLQLPPGTLISENRICRQISVSRTPVRSAITRPVEDELIEVFPQKGSLVAPIKLSAVRNNHFVAKALEIAVLRRASEAWTAEVAARSRQILTTQAAALADEELERFHELDEEFHRAFCSAADLGGVWSTIQIAKARVDRVHRLASGVGRLPLVIAEHGDILDALDGGDRERAEERLDYHLERAPAIMETLIGSHEKYFVE